MLIGYGHADPWKYTPRQMFFYAKLGAQRERTARALDLMIMHTAAQGDSKAVKEQRAKLLKK